ncbi:MAG: hypothetical protein AAF762_00170, partial [Pseudomonadota bacterium]
PAVAKQLQQTLNQPVGLAVYEQQPFLRVQYPQYQNYPDGAKPLFKAVSDEPGYAWPPEAMPEPNQTP